jgi:hypothetical protein
MFAPLSFLAKAGMKVTRVQVESPGNRDFRFVSLLSDFADMSFEGHEKKM